jgi:Asp-tRNA(Asn)/Glu-tRNA(Gln) amidotransferase A subunit family amidase
MLCGVLGTQVVGSILRPSGFCGAYGFKPSVGGINRGGSLDYLSQSVTSTIAASLADAWAMARAVADRVGGDPLSRPDWSADPAATAAPDTARSRAHRQRLGMALTAWQLRGAQCFGAEPECAGATCTITGDNIRDDGGTR